MHKIFLIGSLLSSPMAFANNQYDFEQQCDFHLNGDLEISPSVLNFHHGDKPLYRIENDNTLYVNKQKVTLSEKQSHALQEYNNSIRALIPEVKNIAIEGLNLAAYAVNLSFTELLGENNNVVVGVNKELMLIKQKINERFDTKQIISIDQEGKFIENFFDEGFEQRFESIVETALTESMGTIIQQVLFSGNDMSSFETKMETFGESMEKTMDAQGKLLEEKAGLLCSKVQKLDVYERILQNNIPALVSIDVFTINK